ncbi:helix-turn-helix domain-containing protein [Micromonospora sp. NPDC000207]|uniref:AraC-like ligand-binding domain-containing protein n=1 Tax=Micromonospora sp. NPDC000207 TaxID=3154246 RepID=UPI0033303656
MLHTTVVDTRRLPTADRFDMWLETVSGSSAKLRIRTEHSADFTARAVFTDLGPIRLARHDYPSLTATSPGRPVDRRDRGSYQLGLTVRGGSRCRQEGRDSTFTPGDFTFYDSARPHHLDHHSGAGGHASSVVVIVPHTAVPLPPRRLATLLAARMPGTEGVGRLLAQFLVEVTDHPEHYHAADASRLGTIGLDLITTLLGRHLVAEEEVPAEVRRRALFSQVQAYVRRHLGDTTLGPQVIADAHHVSLRSLHRLFEAEQTTVAAYVRDLRLQRCRGDLADPALRGRSIGSIAARWGFASPAHFSRVFRAAHDTTPQEWRSRHLDQSRIGKTAASTVKRSRAD